MHDPRRRVTAAEHRRVALRCHTALWEFMVGRGTDSEWSDVADAINHVEALLDMGKIAPKDFARPLATAMAGMVQARRNYLATGRMLLPSADHRAAIVACVNEYDRALERFSSWTIAQAGSWVTIKIAGNRDVVVCD